MNIWRSFLVLTTFWFFTNGCSTSTPTLKTPTTAKPTATLTKYDRKAWPHWIDEDNDCQNTRHEILIVRSKLPVKLDPKGCRVVRGQWDDFYYNEVLTSASNVDIDHLIPLKYAHNNGGANWSKEQKQHFANDPENLVITNKKYNRQKGAQSPDTWLPIDRSYAEKYIKQWNKIKSKYSLR